MKVVDGVEERYPRPGGLWRGRRCWRTDDWGPRLESESLPFLLPLTCSLSASSSPTPSSLPLGSFRWGYWVHTESTAEEAGLLMGSHHLPGSGIQGWESPWKGTDTLKDGTDTRPAHSMGPHWHFFV